MALIVPFRRLVQARERLAEQTDRNFAEVEKAVDTTDAAATALTTRVTTIESAIVNIPAAKTVRVTGAAGTTSSTTYVAVPTALSTTFDKSSADTLLIISITGHCWIDDILSNVYVGIDIDGTDYEIDNVSTLAASQAHTFAGNRQISGLAAGTRTCAVQWKVNAAAVVATMVGAWTLMIHEVYAP